MKLSQLLSSALLALALTSCTSTGTLVSNEQAKKIKVGVSTEKDVIAILGKPTTINTSTSSLSELTF